MVRILLPLLLMSIPLQALAAGFAKVGTFAYTYDGMYTGVRQTSLGQADLAGANGPTATQLNIAPLPAGDGIEVSYDRSFYLADTDFEIWGGVAEFRGLRVGFSRFRFFMDPQLVRTAYNPEGTGETFDAGDDIDVLSLGYDLGRLLDGEGRWNWTVGAAWRRYHSFLAETVVDEDTWDLGTTVGWSTRHPGGWTRLSGAVSWQNVSSREFSWDGRASYLPDSVRMGVTLETAFVDPERRAETFRFLLAISRRSAEDGWTGRSSDQVGLELTFARLIAVRAGSNTRLADEFNSWGVGLILDRDFMGPLTVTADFGQYKTIIEWVDMWSAGARYAF